MLFLCSTLESVSALIDIKKILLPKWLIKTKLLSPKTLINARTTKLQRLDKKEEIGYHTIVQVVV